MISHSSGLQLALGCAERCLLQSWLYGVYFIHKEREDFIEHGDDNVNLFIVAAFSEADAQWQIEKWYGETFQSSIPLENYNIQFNKISEDPVHVVGIVSKIYRW